MFGVFPLRPAYGRDYTTQKEVEIDFFAGKDFRTVAGQYCSIRDFPDTDQIEIRYDMLREIAVIKIT